MSIELPFIEDFLLNLKANNYSDETLYNYERDLEVFKIFLKEMELNFENINKKTILNYKAYLSSRDRKTPKGEAAQKKLSGHSINRMISALRSYLKFLLDMDYETPVSPESVKLIKTATKSPRVAELEKVIDFIESPSKFEKNEKIALRNRAILEVFFSTGMRISELIKMKMSDIEKNGRVLVHGKGQKERFVYLTPRAIEHLENYFEIRGEQETPYVFIPFRGPDVSKKDKSLSANYIQEKSKQYRELLGLNVSLTPHGLRRAYATYLAESGANPADIQRLLGHESLDTTTRYVKISDRHARKSHYKFHPLKE